MQILLSAASAESEILGMFAALSGLMLIFWIWFIILWVACYLSVSLPVYLLSKRSGQKNPWLSFIPIAYNLKLFNLAGFNDKTFWTVFLISLISFLVPILGQIVWLAYFALNIYVLYRVAQNFGGDTLIQVLTCIFGTIVLFYFVFTKKEYNPMPLPNEIESVLKKYNLTDDVCEKEHCVHNINIQTEKEDDNF